MAPDPEQLGTGRVVLPRDRHDEPDVVGGDRPLWTPPRWTLAALAVVVILGGLAWYGDHRLRAGEERAMASCQTRLQAASSLSEKRLDTTADYLRPALGTVAAKARTRALMAIMERPALRVLPTVERADARCRAVQVRRWHLTLVARQRAATAYSRALLDRVRAVADSGASYFRPDTALVRLRTAAGLT